MQNEIIMASIGKLSRISTQLREDEELRALELVEKVINAVGKSWSGSCLGYHSSIYLSGFRSPRPGERFSSEWGLMDTWGSRETVGDWVEYSPEDVQRYIEQNAGAVDWDSLEQKSSEAKDIFDDEYVNIVSNLESLGVDPGKNSVFAGLMKEIKGLHVPKVQNILGNWTPNGPLMSRDSTAITAGVVSPVHLNMHARLLAIRAPYVCSEQLCKLASRAVSCSGGNSGVCAVEEKSGSKIFIGHGRSPLWRELKDFIQDRLGLKYEEFNRVPTAGVHTIDRLRSMMDDASFAFIVMTGDDEVTDGKMHPRLNVVHEAGLFQGLLGFNRAIILLEDGCEEFSNIIGLTQIRFPRGEIKSCFEEVRAVLERECVL